MFFASKRKKVIATACTAVTQSLNAYRLSYGEPYDFWRDPFVLGFTASVTCLFARSTLTTPRSGLADPAPQELTILSEVFGQVSRFNGERVLAQYLQYCEQKNADVMRGFQTATKLFLFTFNELPKENDDPDVAQATELAKGVFGSTDRAHVGGALQEVLLTSELRRRFRREEDVTTKAEKTPDSIVRSLHPSDHGDYRGGTADYYQLISRAVAARPVRQIFPSFPLTAQSPQRMICDSSADDNGGVAVATFGKSASDAVVLIAGAGSKFSTVAFFQLVAASSAVCINVGGRSLCVFILISRTSAEKMVSVSARLRVTRAIANAPLTIVIHIGLAAPLTDSCEQVPKICLR